MNVLICADYAEMSKKAAEFMAEQINGKKCVLGLATGSTPEGMYAELIKLHNNGKCDFSGVTSFNLDEYYPLAPEDKQSYRYFMDTKLFNHVNIDKSKTAVPDGLAKDPAAFCEAYDQRIKNAGGVDVQLLGVGPNGHIGFNEPGDELIPGTHLADLTETTIKANSRFFDSIDDVPKQAMTMGVRSILSAKKILLLINGAAKHMPVVKLLEGKVSTLCPVTLLNLHNDVTLICDKEAYYGKN